MAVRSDRAAVRYQADRAADAVAAAAAAAAAVTAHSAAAGAAERDGIDIIDGNQRHGSAIYGGYFARSSGAVAAIDAASAPGDRKRVVWGKSVSVRVELGGPLII